MTAESCREKHDGSDAAAAAGPGGGPEEETAGSRHGRVLRGAAQTGFRSHVKDSVSDTNCLLVSSGGDLEGFLAPVASV